VLYWLSIEIVIERRTDTISMHSTNLSCLVCHLVQRSLKMVSGVYWQVLTICRAEIWSSKLRNSAWVIQILEDLRCILASKDWGLWGKESGIWLIYLFNCLEVWHHWFLICEEICIKWLDLDLIVDIFIWGCIGVNIINLSDRLMFSTLGSGNSFEIILSLFDICVNLLFIIELFHLLLLYLLL
jgi:hypothetical protein